MPTSKLHFCVFFNCLGKRKHGEWSTISVLAINNIFLIFRFILKLESKETYGQTRGLSNLEMKYVSKLAIIGALLKAKQA